MNIYLYIINIKTKRMSEYGVKVGCYKFNSQTNDNGRIVHIKKTTKKFVELDIYNYYDNKYSMPHITSHESDKINYLCFKKKQVKQSTVLINFKVGGSLFIDHHNHYLLYDEYYIGDNTYVEWKQKNKVVNEVEEEQPPSPDDGTADYDIDEQLEKEKEPIIEKIFSTEVNPFVECPKCDGGGTDFCDCEVDEIINDSIMKDPEVCKMLAKNHILEILFNELFKNPCPYKTQDKYYIEVCNAIHKL